MYMYVYNDEKKLQDLQIIVAAAIGSRNSNKVWLVQTLQKLK